MGFFCGYKCDKCGDGYEYRSNTDTWLPNKSNLVMFARNKGFSVGKKVLCSKCRQKKKQSI